MRPSAASAVPMSRAAAGMQNARYRNTNTGWTNEAPSKSAGGRKSHGTASATSPDGHSRARRVRPRSAPRAIAAPMITTAAKNMAWPPSSPSRLITATVPGRLIHWNWWSCVAAVTATGIVTTTAVAAAASQPHAASRLSSPRRCRA